jgi:hypothetical protein
VPICGLRYLRTVNGVKNRVEKEYGEHSRGAIRSSESSGSVGNHWKPKELRMADSQRKSERATLYGALAQLTRDFVKERLIDAGAVLMLANSSGGLFCPHST